MASLSKCLLYALTDRMLLVLIFLSTVSKKANSNFHMQCLYFGGLSSLYPCSVEGDWDDRMEHCVSSDNLPFVFLAIRDGYFAGLTAITLSADFLS